MSIIQLHLFFQTVAHWGPMKNLSCVYSTKGCNKTGKAKDPNKACLTTNESTVCAFAAVTFVLPCATSLKNDTLPVRFIK